MECSPAFDYARENHQTEISAGGVCFRSTGLCLELATKIPLEHSGTGVAEFTLQEEQTAIFVLREIEAEAGCGGSLSEHEEEELLRQTVEYWRWWLSKCTYTGRWRETVHRSALALKVLTFEPTGAIVAAPTCSLPESLVGERNWDYRYLDRALGTGR